MDVNKPTYNDLRDNIEIPANVDSPGRYEGHFYYLSSLCRYVPTDHRSIYRIQYLKMLWVRDSAAIPAERPFLSPSLRAIKRSVALSALQQAVERGSETALSEGPE